MKPQTQIVAADSTLLLRGPGRARPRRLDAVEPVSPAPGVHAADAAWLACLASASTTATVYVASGLVALTAPVALAAIVVPLLVAGLGTALSASLACGLFAAVAVLLTGFGIGHLEGFSLAYSVFAFFVPAVFMVAAARKLR